MAEKMRIRGFKHRERREANGEKGGVSRLILLLFGLFAGGIAFGALMAGNGSAEAMGVLQSATSLFSAERASQPLFTTFVHSISASGSLLLLLFFCGFWAVGQPVELFIPLFKGLGLGMSMGYLYLYYHLKGVLFSLALILPQAFLSSLAIILAGKESIQMSSLLFKMLAGGRENAGGLSIVRLYCTKFMILGGMILLAALVDCVCTFAFARFFVM